MEGDEFWLNGLSDFPINIASTGLDTSNKSGITSALMSLSETESSYLSKPDELCLEYAKGLYFLLFAFNIPFNPASSLFYFISAEPIHIYYLNNLYFDTIVHSYLF